MAVTKTLIKSRATNDRSTASILTHVNDELGRENDSCMFVTVFLCILDLDDHTLKYSNAGHNPPILLRDSGETIELTDGGLSLGIDARAKYDERPISFSKGDILIFFTDGVTEAQNSKGEQYEDANLIAVVKENKNKPASEIVHIIADSVRDFKADDFILDDLTIMMLKVL